MTKFLTFLSTYAKMHTAILGGLMTFIVQHWAGAWWLPLVTLSATALGVGAIANKQKSND